MPGDRRTTICSMACVGAKAARERPPKPKVERTEPYDPRSPLRQAWEAKDWDKIIDEIKTRTVRIDDCWIWQGRSAKGYPMVRIGKRYIGTHRISASAGVRRELGKEQAHHTCAKPMCVNPKHVIPATAAANTAEMKARNSYIARIKELEDALRLLDPHHPKLGMLPIY